MNLNRAIREVRRQYRWQTRKSTSKSRCLPDFIIIGAMKSGTSSLFHYLAQHPQVFSSFHKEPHYFDNHYDKGEQWYRAHFPLTREMSPDSKTGEASPLYIFNPLVANRIHQLVPNAKLIAILRNPVDRAISHYFHVVRNKRERLPMMEAFQSEDKRLQPALQDKDYRNPAFIRFSYKRRGLYREQLERYWQRFSKEQLLILNSEAFFENPEQVLRKVFRFLGIDEKFEVADLKPRNVASNRTDVDAEVYEYLQDYFEPHNEELFAELGERFPWGEVFA